MWQRRLLAGLAIATVVGALACQWIAGIGNAHLGDDAGGDGSNACASPNVPSQPSPDASSPSDLGTFTMALSQVMLGDTDGGPYYGFNLDKTCTCPGTSSCTTTDFCDDEGGIDNYARRIFEQINMLNPDGGYITEQRLNSAITSGLSGALIEVKFWNGTPNDAVVRVTMYGSDGFVGYDAGMAPKFDGTDNWYIDPSSASGSFYTDNAYISNGVLVALSLDFPIIVGSAFTQTVTIQLHTGVIAAKLDIDAGAATQLTGQLGGRWDPARFLPSLAVVPDPLMPGGYLCPGTFTYKLIKQRICSNLDINQDPSGDNGVGSCNAVSMGLGFVATPAKLGLPGTPPDSGSPCQGNMDNCP